MSTSNTLLSVVIPCYNEAESLPELVAGLSIFQDSKIEFILVNNGSFDGSKILLDKLALESEAYIKVLHLDDNLGYGGGILAGLKICTGHYVGWTHADLQTDPKDLLRILPLIEPRDKNILIKGSRVGRSLVERFFSYSMTVFELLVFRRWMPEINAQPTILPRAEVESWVAPPSDFSLDLYAYVMASSKAMKVIRLMVKFPPRQYGNSTWNHGLNSVLKFSIRTIKFSIKLKRKIS